MVQLLRTLGDVPLEQALQVLHVRLHRLGVDDAASLALIYPKLVRQGVLTLGATDVLNKPPALTFVVIHEVEIEDWGVNGLPSAGAI